MTISQTGPRIMMMNITLNLVILLITIVITMTPIMIMMFVLTMIIVMMILISSISSTSFLWYHAIAYFTSDLYDIYQRCIYINTAFSHDTWLICNRNVDATGNLEEKCIWQENHVVDPEKCRGRFRPFGWSSPHGEPPVGNWAKCGWGDGVWIE